MVSSKSVSFLEVESLLRGNDNFVVIAHMRPDGDAIGSTIAMGEALRQLGKKVVMLNEDGVPHNLRFMSGSENVDRTPDHDVEADVVISLDNGSWRRLGDRSVKMLENVQVCLNIDHHETNDCYGDICCIMPEKSSTGELLYDLFKFMNLVITPPMRDALYVAISTDTGSFQYERTTPEVMEKAADLIRLGCDVHEINRNLYQETSWNKMMAVREVLNHMHLVDDGRLAYCAFTNKGKVDLGISDDDTEGLIDILRSIRGVVLAVFFEEQHDGKIRISMRSKDQSVPVNHIAAEFGGGGHALAAGIRMRCPLGEAQQKILSALQDALKNA